MGNTHTKESRGSSRYGSNAEAGGSSSGAGYHGDLPDRSRRATRQELTALGLLSGGSSSRQHDAPFERRETRQEKEARRLEKEKAARIKERERSMKEEHVDGGYVVTTGIYNASEDFSKPVVRQLQIERRIAPFWRGLDDFNDSWAEHQIIAAARGLDIPPPDQVPEHLVPQPRTVDSPQASTPHVNSLTVPLGPRTMSASSDQTGSSPSSSLPSPTSPTAPRTSSPLKPHKKALVAALNLSRNGSRTEMEPLEVRLPQDPFVNGQPLEVFLYKQGIECPLCLMYYPPYLNRTRCCCQIICSECFVQIKRPDPHLPEHHGDEGSSETPANPEEQSGELIMEPAKCPYCTQSDFGVTYEPPPFRRGLTYANGPAGISAMGTAMSSTSSLNSGLSPTSAVPPSPANRKRTQSLSANAPGVITTDRIRQDWANKLQTARSQQRRRAAAADALHHAAFVMGNQESRSIFGRPSRFARRRTGDSPTRSGQLQPIDDESEQPSAPEPGPRTSSARTGPSRERVDPAHLESLMMAEAIRLSLADEEERRKKAEKEAKKEAKKREKEERKASKKKGDPYGGDSHGASASSLSLASLGLGRRRGNSAASNLRMEASVAAATASSSHNSEPPGSGPGSSGPSDGKGKAVDRGGSGDAQTDSAGTPASLPIPTTHNPRGSHLRQMSNASSVSSSGMDSMPGSYTGKGLATEDPRASGLSLGGHSDDGDNTSSPEPLFNFRSLAEMVGVPIDGEADVSTGERGASGNKDNEAEEAQGEHVEHVPAAHPSGNDQEDRGSLPKIATDAHASESGEPSQAEVAPPHVMITPETPAVDDNDGESKQLGRVSTAERPHVITQ
ncbi:hypothetical protein F4778DRAFT_801924 [Xylariomycetidae sp. FL2044]|nr:hypothetical protein F4778DRAFT_801924 [Xylariomycetidae sp. FL2044]